MQRTSCRRASIVLATITLIVIAGVVLFQTMRTDVAAPGEREANFGRQVTVARLLALHQHANDRDLAMLSSYNWVSWKAIEGLLSPSAPGQIPWRNKSATDWQPTLVGPDGANFTVPGGDDAFRLGECVFLPLAANASQGEWSLVLLAVPGRDDEIMVMTGTRASFVSRKEFPAMLVEQNALRAARGAAPIVDPQSLPDLLHLQAFVRQPVSGI